MYHPLTSNTCLLYSVLFRLRGKLARYKLRNSWLNCNIPALPKKKKGTNNMYYVVIFDGFHKLWRPRNKTLLSVHRPVHYVVNLKKLRTLSKNKKNNIGCTCDNQNHDQLTYTDDWWLKMRNMLRKQHLDELVYLSRWLVGKSEYFLKK